MEVSIFRAPHSGPRVLSHFLFCPWGSPLTLPFPSRGHSALCTPSCPGRRRAWPAAAPCLQAHAASALGEEGLGQGQENVVETAWGGVTVNPWPSSALWPRAWGQGQLCAVWSPEQNASEGRPGRSSYDVTACGPSEDEPCGMCTEPARSPSRDGADVQERRPSAGSRSHTSPERPSPSAPWESMACVGTRDPRGPQEGPPCGTINSSMPSFAIHEVGC